MDELKRLLVQLVLAKDPDGLVGLPRPPEVCSGVDESPKFEKAPRVPKLHEISQLKSEISATLFELSDHQIVEFSLAIQLC